MLRSILWFVIAVVPNAGFAQSLTELTELALKKSTDLRAAQSEAEAQSLTAKVVSRGRVVPQVTVGASRASVTFDRKVDAGSGQFVSNDGEVNSLNVTLSYDLQRLFGPEANIAQISAKNAESLREVVRRAVVRDVKKAFWSVIALRQELASFRALLDRFSKVGGVLERERSIGVDTSLEQSQFRLQRDLVESELEARTTDLDSAYANMALLLGENLKATEARFSIDPNLKPEEPRSFSGISPEELMNDGDPVILKSLAFDSELARREADGFVRAPLPGIYLRGSRDNTTIYSGDGPQSSIEVGLALPLEAFATRGAQKAALQAKAIKADALKERALLEYQNQIRIQANLLRRVSFQRSALIEAESKSQKLLDRSFRFYAQRRIDAVGATDIFQKHLQAVRNVLLNSLQIRTSEAELEYLLGRGLK